MAYIIVGLGNPGEEYENTRHNTGRMVTDAYAEVAHKKAKVITPDSFMNVTGKAIATQIKNPEKLIVVYDDFNLPLGSIRISYNRSAGGHNGLASIIKALKTEAFVRVRIGVAPTTPTGKIKVPHGDGAIEKFILGEFKEAEMKVIKKMIKTAIEAIDTIIEEGREIAMGRFNGK